MLLLKSIKFFIFSNVFCSGHEHLSSNGISSPPDRIGDGRHLVDITEPFTTFCLDIIINMTSNFSRGNFFKISVNWFLIRRKNN